MLYVCSCKLVSNSSCFTYVPIDWGCLPALQGCLPALWGCLPALRGCLPALQGCLPALGYQVFRKNLFWEPGNHIPRKNLIPGLPRLIPQKGRGKKTASFLVRTKYQICRLTGNFDPSPQPLLPPPSLLRSSLLMAPF